MRTAFVLSILACGFCWRQATDDSRPATTNIMGAEYPRVHTDLRVTFQLKAPEAQKVQVRLGDVYDMKRAADGVWSVIVPSQIRADALQVVAGWIGTHP
jgi:1,4-alpha-glucan branching enzyme